MARLVVWLVAFAFVSTCWSCVEAMDEVRVSVDPVQVRDIRINGAIGWDQAQDHFTTGTLTVDIYLDGYLDVDRSRMRDGIAVASGAVHAPGEVDYVMSERRLTYTSFAPLREGLAYTIEIDETQWRDHVNRPVRASLETTIDLPPVRTSIVPDDDSENDGREEPSPSEAEHRRSFARDVEAIFDRACAGCHGIGGLPSLTPSTLRNVRSATLQDTFLVIPYDASRSMLMHKILVDYPVRYGATMPPPWSDQPPLTDTEVRAIEAWILDGARP